MTDSGELIDCWRGTVVELLVHAAAQQPEQPALVCEGETLDYVHYRNAVIGLASRLREAAAPARVAVIMRNGIGACIAHFGVLASGAQLLPMNPEYTARELRYQLEDADCDAVIADSALHELVAPLAASLNLPAVWMDSGVPRATEQDAGVHGLPPKVDPRSLAVLQYTGGTSGRPKGVNLTHAALRTNVEQREAMLPTRPAGERILCAMPLFHSYGMAMGLYLAARCAGTLVILPAFRRDDLFDAIERHRITLFPGSPSIYVSLMAHPRFESTDWSSLHMCYSGASALPVAVLRRWEETVKVPIYEGYGMTEAGPVLSFNGPGHAVRAGSVGLPLPGTRIEIVDAETGQQTLGARECGEIRAQGPQLMQGYRNLSAETSEALRDGWLYTGDLGEIDGDGHLFVRGRKKDLIIVGGYNVYPREIEEVLQEHPAVLEAAVVGKPDSYRGEILLAFVVPRPGMDDATDETALGRHCAERLARYKQPARYFRLPSLPKTPINKVDRKALSALAAEQFA
ncbi:MULTISPECIES: AMP-binding protein [unclassified Variovorax]|uniref:class I adenylate-forming enzyme family protein n=1 Tax=unclassified Variovorax TaxID=663243 RepID=UPI00076D23EB|nr:MULTISPECIES: AMP-binding protein [unclassified Variovorax]KWT92083.1 Long-chain-fatty-acid--CoA ligase [Variovorax sp. WDL1]PNG47014.1 Long-chain-fatty-acid--CoA ligase [Variovorax sp. B2]PNG48335.1 Long-chain-fatty-acid--CoA ligase [Variovorax sp. B4]VTV14866.1 Long-chain-fatty-acid--CoA ligase [Variovorax sp. WDL1]